MNRVLLTETTANCRRPGVDPEDFFPRQGAMYAPAVARAKRLCNGWPTTAPCPLRDACREYGVRHQVSGVWGGLSEDERKAERKRRRIVATPLSTGALYAMRSAS